MSDLLNDNTPNNASASQDPQNPQDNNLADSNSTVTPPAGVAPTRGRRKEILSSTIPGEAETSPQPNQELEQAAPTAPEHEVSAVELEPTIEKLEQEVERQKVKGPQKVAVRKEKAADPTPKTVAQPVVVLPISEQTMQQGNKKNASFSVKWLVTWAKRQMKKFKEILVVWRDTPYNQK